MLSLWTANDITGLVKEAVELVIAVTGLVVALRAGTRSKVADLKADNATKSAETANQRASNNAQAITGVQQTLTQVVAQSPPIVVTPVQFPSKPEEQGQ